MLKIFLGYGFRRGERFKYLVSLLGALAMSVVLAAGAATKEPVAVQAITTEQAVFNARQVDQTDRIEARLKSIEDYRIGERLSAIETTTEWLVWAARGSYAVAATLMLNLLATLWQMRQSRERRGSR